MKRHKHVFASVYFVSMRTNRPTYNEWVKK